MSKNGVDFRTNAGTGIVRADGFETTEGVRAPAVVVAIHVTIDPPSLTTGAFAEADVTVTGVAVGDKISLYPPYDTQAIMYQGSVAAANTVTVAFSSCNSGTIDLPSGSWGVVAERMV